MSGTDVVHVYYRRGFMSGTDVGCAGSRRYKPYGPRVSSYAQTRVLLRALALAVLYHKAHRYSFSHVYAARNTGTVACALFPLCAATKFTP
eukprot:680524-Rhodomonas_salina.1